MWSFNEKSHDIISVPIILYRNTSQNLNEYIAVEQTCCLSMDKLYKLRFKSSPIVIKSNYTNDLLKEKKKSLCLSY